MTEALVSASPEMPLPYGHDYITGECRFSSHYTSASQTVVHRALDGNLP